MCLGFRIERAVKVGLICLKIAWATDGVLLIVSVNAACSKDGAMNLLLETTICQVESADDIASDGLLLVILAPVDIWPAGAASAVKYMRWLNSLKLLDHRLPVLHADGGSEDFLALALQESFEMASNPSLASPDEVDIVGGSVRSAVCSSHSEFCSVRVTRDIVCIKLQSTG